LSPRPKETPVLIPDFPPDEYQVRLAGAQALMAERGLDALLLTTQGNVRYYTGHHTHRWLQSTAPQLAVVPAHGRPHLVLPGIELGRARTNPVVESIRAATGYSRIGVAELVTLFHDLGLERGTIGAELGSYFRFGMPVADLDAVREALPGLRLADASDLFWAQRMVKSQAEIACLRRAAAIADAAFDAVMAAARPGVTERQLHAVAVQAVMAEGAEAPGSIPVASRSPGTAHPWDNHLRLHTDRAIQAGDLVWLDIGAIWKGYWSDYFRMFCVGRAPDAWKDAYRFVHRATHAAIEETRANTPASLGIARVQEMMRASPYASLADGLAKARIAHGIGLDLTEPPSLSFTDRTLIVPGMVLTIEPGIYLPEIGFFMLEEDVLVTEAGPEILSRPAPAELPELG
jgi:Xaa-Pro dipeptidase